MAHVVVFVGRPPRPLDFAFPVLLCLLLGGSGCDPGGSGDPVAPGDDDSILDDDDTTAEWQPTFTGSSLFRYDAARTGSTELGADPTETEPGIVWSQPAQGILGLAVAQNTVFCLGTDGARALVASTGDVQWTAELSGPFRGPAVADGRLVVEDFGGQVAALDASNGALLWQAAVNDGVSSQASPLLLDGVAYVGGGGSGGSASTGMHAFDLTTGSTLWTFRDEARWSQFDASYVELGPASLEGGTVYFAAVGSECANSQCDHRMFTIVYALDAATGSLVWEHEMPATWDLNPLPPLPIGAGKVLIAGLRATAIGSTTLPNGKMVALDQSTGAQAWVVDYGPSDGRFGSNPAVADSIAYVGVDEWDGSAWNRYLAAYQLSDGERLWATPVGGSGTTVAGPFVVYASSDPGNGESALTVLRASDGAVMSQEPLAGAASQYSLPIVHGGMAFILTSERAYAIHLPQDAAR